MGLKNQILSRKLGMKLCLYLCAALLSVSVSFSSYAQPTSPCDPEYMDALEARAWLEAQREIQQNKNYIFKPDSVLEYTCFHGFLDEAASNFGGHRQFSETDRWDGHPVDFSNETTDIALTNVVLAPMNAWLVANFHTEGDMGAYLNNRTPVEYVLVDAVDGGRAYGCAEMQAVWQVARCMQFNEELAFDGFFDFAYYEGEDAREEQNAWALMCETPDPRVGAARVTAFNEDQVLFNVETEIPAAEGNGAPYLEDDIVTHLDFILPGTCDGPAVATGITVERPDINGGSPYPERVCTNPGCTNPPGSGTCCTNPPGSGTCSP